MELWRVVFLDDLGQLQLPAGRSHDLLTAWPCAPCFHLALLLPLKSWRTELETEVEPRSNNTDGSCKPWNGLREMGNAARVRFPRGVNTFWCLLKLAERTTNDPLADLEYRNLHVGQTESCYTSLRPLTLTNSLIRSVHRLVSSTQLFGPNTRARHHGLHSIPSGQDRGVIGMAAIFRGD